MSHENSITEQVDGKWINIPSVVNGKSVSNDRAVKLYKKGKLKALPDRKGKTSWDTMKGAVSAAKARSNVTDPNSLKQRYAGGGQVLPNTVNQQTESMLANRIDPVSGNDVPPGSSPEEVRDNIPALLSKNEYVLPANVVKHIGVDKIQKMHKNAERELNVDANLPVGYNVGTPGDREYAEGGSVLDSESQYTRTTVLPYQNPETGDTMLVTFYDGTPIFNIPEGYVPSINTTDPEPASEPVVPPPAAPSPTAPTIPPQAQVTDDSSDGGDSFDYTTRQTTQNTVSLSPSTQAELDKFTNAPLDYVADEVVYKANEAFNKAKETIEAIPGKIVSIPGKIYNAVTSIPDKIAGIPDKIGDKINEVGTRISNFVNDPLADVTHTVEDAFNTINFATTGATVGGFAGPVGRTVGSFIGAGPASYAADDIVGEATGVKGDSSYFSIALNALTGGIIGQSAPEEAEEDMISNVQDFTTMGQADPTTWSGTIGPNAEAFIADQTLHNTDPDPGMLTNITRAGSQAQAYADAVKFGNLNYYPDIPDDRLTPAQIQNRKDEPFYDTSMNTQTSEERARDTALRNTPISVETLLPVGAVPWGDKFDASVDTRTDDQYERQILEETYKQYAHLTPSKVLENAIYNVSLDTPSVKVGSSVRTDPLSPEELTDLTTLAGQAAHNKVSVERQQEVNAYMGVGPGTARDDMYATPGKRDKDGWNITQPTYNMVTPSTISAPVAQDIFTGMSGGDDFTPTIVSSVNERIGYGDEDYYGTGYTQAEIEASQRSVDALKGPTESFSEGWGPDDTYSDDTYW